MHIPIHIVVQSNRGGVKEGDDETPNLEDIRDSDGISHNATKVLALRQEDDTLIIAVKKNRDGKNGDKLCYRWDIDKGEFEHVEMPSSRKHDEDEMPILKTKKQSKKPVF
jgi:replicative DNA helicase